eukprot:CAMPEP_0184714720 /NCGR_PEP_ID=MMETSP0314-20130426/4791_1 /TAXON_ID=38298 /ORGANISM="Rhodella maculata, Strain CCMP 736" /LENGTH=70 /DNA_ID=CAMNT_0027177687 /DNA_START=19 /DNA_END=231 /DNA_ORIENTATION=-
MTCFASASSAAKNDFFENGVGSNPSTTGRLTTLISESFRLNVLGGICISRNSGSASSSSSSSPPSPCGRI